MKPINIAITGASGFIGSYLTGFLRQLNYQVKTMGRSAADENHITFTLGKNLANHALTNTDVLIHAAYDFSALGYAAIKKTNVEGSLQLFEEARTQGVKKIIYISSTSSFKEAVADYGRAKYEMEQRAAAFDIITVRPGLVFAKQNGGIIQALEKFVMKFPFVPIIGDGQQEFYPCHVQDLSKLIAALIERDDHAINPIIAASEEKITFKKLLLTLADRHHRSVVPISVPYRFVFAGLKLAEVLRLKSGLRSDSLKFMKFSNKVMDFSATRALDIAFRPFTVTTLQT
jgi:nucleoside-diphosphate-sugar epimerase